MVWSLVLLPVVAVPVVVTASRRGTRVLVASLGAILGATLVLGVIAAVARASGDLRWSPELGLHLAVRGFGRVMVVLVPAVATPILVYAAATEREGRARLLGLMTAFVGAMLLLVAAADLLTLLVAWELVGALSWTLIGHGWRDPANPRLAAQAFIATRFGDLGLYLAAGAAFAATRSFSFEALGSVSGTKLDLVAVGVLLAAAAKSAQLPFSPWLFSAMAGPTPVSALLHSSTMVAAGAYLLIRLGPALDATGWFGPVAMWLGLTTAIAAGVVASLHTHPKRVLAGSTSAQYGLMFAAVGAGSTAAAAAQLVTHAAFKSLLFLSAGVAIHAAGTEDLRAMRLGRLLPRVAVLAGVGALALAAVPPLGGAWSKEEIVAAVAGNLRALPSLAVFGAAFLTVLYAARFWLLGFGPEREAAVMVGNPVAHAVRERRERSLAYLPGTPEMASLGLLAVASLALGFLWVPGGGRIVETLTAGGLPSAAHVVVHRWHEQLISLGLIASAFLVVGVLWRQERIGGVRTSRLRAGAAEWLWVPVLSRVLVVGPVLGLSRLLARIDDRVIDAGVRAAGWIASQGSRLLGLRVEVSVDGLVRGVGAGTMLAAAGSRSADERGVDHAVEGVALGVGAAGRSSRRLQSGLSHHYYVILAAGLVVAVAILAITR